MNTNHTELRFGVRLTDEPSTLKWLRCLLALGILRRAPIGKVVLEIRLPREGCTATVPLGDKSA